jgi:hypothetical protein
MSTSSYGQFCPVAKACEILEPRWTVLILMVILGGTSRFNEIRRGVPGVSPSLPCRSGGMWFASSSSTLRTARSHTG